MNPSSPNHRYYLANHGLWRCLLTFTIVNWRTFWRTKMGLMDRIRAISMWFMPKLIGKFQMETVVDYHQYALTEGKVLHETRIIKWGMLMMDSSEVFQLDEDGKGVEILGKQRLWPWTWREVILDNSRAIIDDAGKKGVYEFDWFGATLHQIVEITDEGCTLTQYNDWYRGVQHLVRVSTTLPNQE